MLVLETEGLKSLEEDDDDEFGKMVMTFVLLNCNLVICHS